MGVANDHGILPLLCQADDPTSRAIARVAKVIMYWIPCVSSPSRFKAADSSLRVEGKSARFLRPRMHDSFHEPKES